MFSQRLQGFGCGNPYHTPHRDGELQDGAR